MKPEPLKGKVYHPFNDTAEMFDKKDIKSAVKWLKLEVETYFINEWHGKWFNNKIEEAFEDVMKEELRLLIADDFFDNSNKKEGKNDNTKFK